MGLRLLTFLLLFSMHANAQLTNGLVAHWEFNGNLNDATGNGHNGTGSNITYAPGQAGLPNTAAVFNGTSSYAQVAYKASLSLSNYSICAIVKPTGFYQGACQGNFILFRGSEGQPGSYGLGFFDNCYNSCNQLDTTKHVFYAQAGSTSGTPANFQSAVKVHTQIWYCVTATFDGSSIKIYVNGTLTATYPVTGSMGTSSDPIGIGKYLNGQGTGYPYWYNGLIDDLRLYNRALTANEVSTYCGAVTPPAVSVFISHPLTKLSICPGDTLHVNYDITGTFNTGNTFTVQLSDASGNFSNPVAIGSVTATTAGKIVCTIPAGTAPGTGYRVRVVASNPSATSADNGVDIAIGAAPSITLIGKTSVCKGENLQVTANVTPANIPVNWTGPNGFTDTAKNFTITNAAPVHSGRYIITASNNGCTTKDTADVRVDSLHFSLGNDTSLCNSSLVLNPAIPGATYLWQDGSTGNTYTVSSTGQYFVQVTLGACIQADTINVKSVNIALELPADTALCPDSTLTLTAPAGYDSYTWSNGDTGNSITIYADGPYWLKVGKEGCVAWDSILVKQLEPYFLLGNDTTICNHHTLILRATSLEGSKYRWQDGSTGQTYNVREEGIYFVTATNICGEFKANILVEEMQCLCEPFMPNAFTPDGNGLNDAIGPIMTCVPSKFRFAVFNRWGQQVYETEQFGNKWNGRFGGEVMGMDTYFYMIQVTDMLGNESLHKGDFHLLR